MRFLIIDNDKTTREVICFLLEEEGHSAECLAWTEQMPSGLKEKNADAVLLDLDSSPVEGLGPLLEIQGARPDLPVVLLLVEDRLKLAAEVMRHGILEILEKPFRREHLILVVARLKRHLEMRRRLEWLEQQVATGPEAIRQQVVIALTAGNTASAREPHRARGIAAQSSGSAQAR
jgi:DNA-binding NtrC family response regulator